MSGTTPTTGSRHDFTGKVAIVTGAAQGIGEAYARALAAAGAAVVIADVSGLLIRWRLTAGPNGGAAMVVRRGVHAELSLHTAFRRLPSRPTIGPVRACPCLSVDVVHLLSVRSGVRAFLSVRPAPAGAACPCNRCWRA
jgi:NAD(P)-dependent dehydrogenase (short-subunit alcohol dehydrogenase family)